jgi:hypothetical protein
MILIEELLDIEKIDYEFIKEDEINLIIYLFDISNVYSFGNLHIYKKIIPPELKNVKSVIVGVKLFGNETKIKLQPSDIQKMLKKHNFSEFFEINNLEDDKIEKLIKFIHDLEKHSLINNHDDNKFKNKKKTEYLITQILNFELPDIQKIYISFQFSNSIAYLSINESNEISLMKLNHSSNQLWIYDKGTFKSCFNDKYLNIDVEKKILVSSTDSIIFTHFSHTLKVDKYYLSINKNFEVYLEDVVFDKKGYIEFEYYKQEIKMDKMNKNYIEEFCKIEYDLLEIKEMIGKGSYGTVYKGKWSEMNVAIKQLNHSDDDFSNEKIINEIIISKSCQNINLVR